MPKEIYQTSDGLRTIPLEKNTARNIEKFFRAVTFSMLILIGGMFYSKAVEEHGSFNNAYTFTINRYPVKMFNPNL